MYQRFAFENLRPEQQSEIVDKQLRQQHQRTLLERQIAERAQRRNADAPPKHEYPEQPAPAAAVERNSPVRSPPVHSSPTILSSAAMVFSAPQRAPLLEKRIPRERPPITMALTAGKIHETFAALRSQFALVDTQR
jgi:hypothetical protein